MIQNGLGGGVGVTHDLRISVLGGFDVEVDGRSIEASAWPRNRARALVKLLALATGHRLHREQLIDALWPALDEAAGSGNLRKAIHFARRAIGAEHIRFEDEIVALDAPRIFVDVVMFDEAIQTGRRADALALYRADLLPEDRFEPWAEDPRERLRMRFHRLLLDEASRHDDAGRLDLAADLLERLVASDPLNEEAYLRLVRVLARAGSRHLALARFDELERRLRDELHVEPESALRRLVEDITSGSFPPYTEEQVGAEGPRAFAGPTGEPGVTPLIGREHELRAVLGLFEEAVATNRPRLVELSGTAGVGKSRLAAEVVARVKFGRENATILRGRCTSGERGGAFDALGEILRGACGIEIVDTANQARSRLRQRLETLLGDLEAVDRDPTVYALALTAGIALPGNPLERLSPSAAFERLALAWPILASALAFANPTVLLIEDVHWARSELLELVERIVSRSEGPLMVIVTARPEIREQHPAFGADEASRFVIQPLADAASERLLEHALEGAVLESRLRAGILARAEGNPFFIEQLSHHAAIGSTSGLPDTLQTLLAARLDSLPPAERRVLQEASVVGRTFWEGPISTAIPGERIAARLASLERKGFVVRRSTSSLPGQPEYTIRHALLHDATYASLSRARRARAHVATGTWLERIAGDRVDEVVQLLAHHFWSALSANVPELGPSDGVDRETIRAKAYGYAMRAGEAARRRFVTDNARELHARALELSASVEERLAALESLARDHEDEFHGDLAAELYREALRLARDSAAHRAERARLCRRLAWLMAWNPGAFRSNPDAGEAEALVDEGMAHAPDDPERAWLLLVRGACARLYRGSEPLGQGAVADPLPIAQRLAAAEQAMVIAHKLGIDELALAAENVLGLLYGIANNYRAMLALARRQVADLRPDQSRLDQSDALRKLATHVINVEADFEQGLVLGLRCRHLLGATGVGGPHQVMHALWPVLASLFFLGRWEELLEPLGEHVQSFRAEPAMECQFVRDGPAIGATALALLGRVDEADATAGLLGDPLAHRESASAWQARWALCRGEPQVARAISHDKALEGRVYGPQHACVMLDVLLRLEDRRAASAFLPIARASAPGNALIAPSGDRLEGWLHIGRGDRSVAARSLRRAVRGFHELKVPQEEAVTLRYLAAALSPAEADRAREEALAIEQRLGLPATSARLRPATAVSRVAN